MNDQAPGEERLDRFVQAMVQAFGGQAVAVAHRQHDRAVDDARSSWARIAAALAGAV